MCSLVLNNGMFTELEKDEMLLIEGGGFWKALVLTAGCVVTALAPVTGIAAGIGGSIIGTPAVGVLAGLAGGCGMAAAGTNIIDYGLSLK